MRNIVLSTGVLQFMFSGLYDSMWYDWLNDFDSDLEDEEYRELAEKTMNQPIYKDKLIKDISVYIIGELSDRLKPLGFIEFGDFVESWSPREYNFDTDRFSFGVKVDVNKLIAYLKRFSYTKMYDFHKNNWDSCSGFYSYMPSMFTITDIMKQTEHTDQELVWITSFAIELCRYYDTEIEDFGDVETKAFEDFMCNHDKYNYFRN